MWVPGTRHELVTLDEIKLSDIQAMRLILRGHSVVDWHKLHLHSLDDVKRFLHVNCFDPSDEKDVQRLRHLLRTSADYLEKTFNYHFPEELRNPVSITDLFLIASSSSEFQNLACVILKVMHIVNHIEARQLRYRLPVSEDFLYREAEDAVNRTVAELIAAGAPITTYKSSRKSRDSLITKLLAKKNTQASQVFDRLRFRIVTRTALDIIPVLVYLKDHLLPYNYVVPGESRNEILDFQDVIEAIPGLRQYANQLQFDFQLEEAADDEAWNRFSAADFRMINFIVDMPLRVDSLLKNASDSELEDLGYFVFVLVEFQIFDEQTDRNNQAGDASHAKYKERQKWEVIRRLVYGGEGTA
ncbi:MAG: TIGR04552 family protein, partial [Deltaproteobacteria bacterium]|nr:TIGR04552 family protein [Deltaproteobacteria bacterium]